MDGENGRSPRERVWRYEEEEKQWKWLEEMIEIRANDAHI